MGKWWETPKIIGKLSSGRIGILHGDFADQPLANVPGGFLQSLPKDIKLSVGEQRLIDDELHFRELYADTASEVKSERGRHRDNAG